MKSPHRPRFSLLFPLINLFVVFVVCSLIYLLFGHHFTPLFADGPEPVAVTAPAKNNPEEKVVNGIHEATGFVYAKGFKLVRANCTACHSAKLVTQNRATREGWATMIDWMQETQGLWDLGENEGPILDYLAEHYAPKAVGRRANLPVEEIEWYVLDLAE